MDRPPEDARGMAQNTEPPPLLEIRGLSVAFRERDGSLAQAVRDVSIDIRAGRTTAIVGQSGSGKSVTAMSVLGLLPQGAQCSGQVIWNGGGKGIDLLRLSPRELRAIRGKDIAMIFQEPMTSLNPVFTIGEQIAEAVQLHERATRKQAMERAEALLTEVGITPAASLRSAYPHEFSGGMRQRAMIAMALACGPRILIADEPTTALDVSVRAHVLDLLMKLQQERGLAILLITHDLLLVGRYAHDVVVIKGGDIVEHGEVSRVLSSPRHPYTRGLLACVPRLGKRVHRLVTMDADP